MSRVRSIVLVAAAMVAATACVVAALDADQEADLQSANSFRPPFDNYDAMGSRIIPSWVVGGSAFLNENFLRLTPDRASKRGYVWNTTPLSTPNDFTITLYFRVSGQGRNLFGDGFALWLTSNSRYSDGPLHGFTDTFKGVGIVFDTFRNLESGHVHKDIAVYTNDGNGPVNLEAGVEPQGCDGDFRYHEGRDDFSVQSRSAAKIRVRDGKLTIMLDARNTGDFRQCVTDYTIPIPGDWTNQLFVGVTASTGQLADNHDLISLVTASGDKVLPEVVKSVPVVTSTGNQQTDATIKSMVESEVERVAGKLKHLHHHLEHQLTSMQDSITNTLKKMQEKEQENLDRIEELERRLDAKMADKVDNSVSDRLANLESTLNSKVDAKLDAELAPRLSETIDAAVSQSGGGWVLPFFVLLAGIVGIGAFGFYKYREMQKTHLL